MAISRHYAQFFRISLPFCIVTKVWLWYAVHDAIFKDAFPQPLVLGLVITAAVIFACLVMFSTLIWGAQIFMTLAMVSITLSHHGIKSRLQRLSPIDTFGKEVTNDGNEEQDNIQEKNDKEAANNGNGEQAIIDILNSSMKLLNLQRQLSANFQILGMFMSMYYVTSIILFGYGTVAMFLSPTNAISTSNSSSRSSRSSPSGCLSSRTFMMRMRFRVRTS